MEKLLKNVVVSGNNQGTLNEVLTATANKYTIIAEKAESLVKAIHELSETYGLNDLRRGKLEAMGDDLSTVFSDQIADIISLEIKCRYYSYDIFR